MHISINLALVKAMQIVLPVFFPMQLLPCPWVKAHSQSAFPSCLTPHCPLIGIIWIRPVDSAVSLTAFNVISPKSLCCDQPWVWVSHWEKNGLSEQALV